MQLARKLVGGELQQITYREYLPIILGGEAIDDLMCTNTEYDPNEDPPTRLFHFLNLALTVGCAVFSPKWE